jgi:phosphohistidine phosphatase
MRLLVIRHAIAEERDAFAETGKDDGERPLTGPGRRKFERGVRGLRRVVPSLDLLATSALVRAVETGAIVQRAYRIDQPARLRELDPAAEPAALVRWLTRQRRLPVVAVVGHEPHLSRLVEHLLAGSERGFLDLKKGGACLLDLGSSPGRGRAELLWLLTAAQLRWLAG